jgi:hypothetical protein
LAGDGGMQEDVQPEANLSNVARPCLKIKENRRRKKRRNRKKNRKNRLQKYGCPSVYQSAFYQCDKILRILTQGRRVCLGSLF